MRTETQAEQPSHAGRYAIIWLRRKPEWVRASLSGWASEPESLANTLRSVLPGKYGHGPPGVRKNCGRREVRWSVKSLHPCDAPRRKNYGEGHAQRHREEEKFFSQALRRAGTGPSRIESVAPTFPGRPPRLVSLCANMRGLRERRRLRQEKGP